MLCHVSLTLPGHVMCATIKPKLAPTAYVGFCAKIKNTPPLSKVSKAVFQMLYFTEVWTHIEMCRVFCKTLTYKSHNININCYGM